MDVVHVAVEWTIQDARSIVGGPGGVVADPAIDGGRPRVGADSYRAGGVPVADVLKAVVAARGDLVAVCTRFGVEGLQPRYGVVAVAYAATVSAGADRAVLLGILGYIETGQLLDPAELAALARAQTAVSAVPVDAHFPPRPTWIAGHRAVLTNGATGTVPTVGERAAVEGDSTPDVRRHLALTPGPWRLNDRGIGYEIFDPRSQPVNSRFRETFHHDDAAFIVAARNIRDAIESGRAPHHCDLFQLFPGLAEEAAPTLAEWLRANTARKRERPSGDQIERGAGRVSADQPVPAAGQSDPVLEPALGGAGLGSLQGRLTFPEDPDDFELLDYDPAINPDDGAWVADLLTRTGSSIGPGWRALIVGCRRSLQSYCQDVGIVDIRQKLGGLTISINIPDDCADIRDDLHAIVARYEAKSREVCEATGQPGVLMENHNFAATMNPVTASPQWRVSTRPPLASAERIKKTPGAVDRLLADLLADNEAAAAERVAEFFAQQRAKRAATTTDEPEDGDDNPTNE